MKLLQEYENDEISESVDVAIKRIAKLPLPYTGNKKKLCLQLHTAIKNRGIKFNSVLDAFSGSGTVSYLFKLMGKRVLSNDLLTMSYINAVSFVENDSVTLSSEEKHFLLHNKSSNSNQFVEQNYLGTQFRKENHTCRFNKFTLKECQFLDNFRANIDELCSRESQSIGLAANAAVVMRLPFGSMDASNDVMTHRSRQKQEYGTKGTEKFDRRIGIYYDEEMNLNFNKWFNKYVTDFTSGVSNQEQTTKIKRAAFLTNLQQHVLRDCMVAGRLHSGQSLAELETRLAHAKNQQKGRWGREGDTSMDFLSTSDLPGVGMKWWTFANANLPGKCLALNMDIIRLLESGFCTVDMAYFDPPYGGPSSDYPMMYRFFEEYIYSCPLEEMPHIQNALSTFVAKKTYESDFCRMLQAAKNIPIWLFSYNDRSWKSIDHISNVIRSFGRNVEVETLSNEYRYLYSRCQGRNTKASEYLLIAH